MPRMDQYLYDSNRPFRSESPSMKHSILATLGCVLCIASFFFVAVIDQASFHSSAFSLGTFGAHFGVMASSQFPAKATTFSNSSASDYVERERPIALKGLLANIGPDGEKASGAAPGIVVASPSTSDPNYVYTWTRDAALVFNVIVQEFNRSQDSALLAKIDDYVKAQAKLQQVPNPSGNVTTGGLGEPKFNVDLSAFTGSWGRPQRDGPALRAITLSTFARLSEDAYVNDVLWPIIELDLNYVANSWNQTGFDLWEEVSSSSFWTTAVQHRALREGIILASKLGKEDVLDQYSLQAGNVLCFLQSYWNSDGMYITSNTGGGRSGIDANSVLASIHTFDPAAGCASSTFQPCSDKALSNLKIYVDSFRNAYEINKDLGKSIATGRYPEDVYMDGNPWYLAISAVGELLYDSLAVWDSQGSLEITSISAPFFRQFSPDVQLGTYDSESEVYGTLTSSIRDYADGFIDVNSRYTPSDGSLAEQFGKSDGQPTSARDLTWSYAAALTSFRARDGFVPPSWGAKGLQIPTDSQGHCMTNSGPMSEVVFGVEKNTVPGENVFITGGIDQLRNWSPKDAIKLSSDDYPLWNLKISLPASTTFSYKYIVKDENDVVTWEQDPNHELTSPEEGQSFTVSDTWH